MPSAQFQPTPTISPALIEKGTAVLVAGVVKVSTPNAQASSNIFLTSNLDGGTPGFLRVSHVTPGVSFTIKSNSTTDTSTVAWAIL